MTSPNPKAPVDALSSASALLRAGQHLQAQQLLTGLLREYPKLAEAHWLLANAFFELHEFGRARKELKICTRLTPGKQEPYLLLGRLFVTNGRLGEAERALRQGLRLDQSSLVAVAALARVLLVRGRPEEVCALVKPFLSRGSATADLLMLHGHALMALGEIAEAANAFRQIVRKEPSNHEARFRLAAVLADSDQPIEAETEARAGIAIGGKTADAAFVLARALMGQGRLAEAEAELRQVVQARPQNITAQANLSELAWMRSGDVEEAGAELDAALRSDPRSPHLRIIKARLLLAAERPGQALAVIETGLAFAESDLALLNAASEIALGFDAARALEYARRALDIAPDDRSTLVGFGNASLGVGDAGQALRTCRKLIRLHPNDGQVLAMQADAWRMLGDARYHALYDYTQFVRSGFIDTPKGWRNLPAYLVDLRRELEQVHPSNAHPVGQSLRLGSQVALVPERSPAAAIRAFPQAIDGPIRRYMEAIGKGSDAFTSRNTGRYQVRGAWSVRLRANGFHLNHYHPRGWLSSACYIDLPAAMGDHGTEGWLQFGKPAFPTDPPLEAEYFLKPRPGLLALFPSYMWHGTVPFSGGTGDTRLTIAFDVVPA